MALLIGAFSIGLILSLLALGVFISFRVFRFPDITAEGSITLGACLAAVLIVRKTDPFLATAAGFLAGAAAGAVTGTLHTKFRIHGLLSGILVMTALYSVNLRVMGKSNVRFSRRPPSPRMRNGRREAFSAARQGSGSSAGRSPSARRPC